MTIPRKRIVMATFGSLGDLHPYLAVAIDLKARGHEVIIATQQSYCQKVEAAGVGFHAVGPDIADYGDEAALMARVMDQRNGPSFIIREMIVPRLRQTYEEITAAVQGADLLLTHPLTLAAQLVAEKQRPHLAWGSVALAPSSFWSAYDPPVLAPLPGLRHLRPLGPWFFRWLFRLMKRSVRAWTQPWHEFRRELGLPPVALDPMFDGQFSPDLTLAMFSPLLASPQPDWPPNTRVTGFPFYDQHNESASLTPELSAFLDAGEPPLVFTLGSSAVMDAGSFYAESLQAARLMGQRAVLLIGRDPRNRPAGPLPDSLAVSEYAPFSKLLPRTAAIVHQGGVGTTGQALRAGRPMLVMPYGFDQPDNAERVVRLGVARTIPRRAYTARRAAVELGALLRETRYAARAAEIGAAVQNEDGAAFAGDVIEQHLQRHA